MKQPLIQVSETNQEIKPKSIQSILLTITKEIILENDNPTPEELNQGINKLGSIMARLGANGLVSMPMSLPEEIIQKISEVKKLNPRDVFYVYKLAVQIWLEAVSSSKLKLGGE